MICNDKTKPNHDLIKRALRMPCTCGNRDHEYVYLDKQETKNGHTYTIPNVPTLRCKVCGHLAYTPHAISLLEEYRRQYTDHLSH